MADQNQDRNQSAAAIWARYSQIAFIIPAAVVIGLFLGKLWIAGCTRAGSFWWASSSAPSPASPT